MATQTTIEVPARVAGLPVHRFDPTPVGEYVARMLSEGLCPGYLAYGRRGERQHWRPCDARITGVAAKRGDLRCGQCARDDAKARATEARDAEEWARTLAAAGPGIAALRSTHPALAAQGPEIAALIADLRAMEPRATPWSVKLQLFAGSIGGGE